MSDRILHDFTRDLNNGRCRPGCEMCGSTWSNWSDALPHIPDPVPNTEAIEDGQRRKAEQRARDQHGADHADGRHQVWPSPWCEACVIAQNVDKRDVANAVSGLADMFSPRPTPKGFRREPDAVDRFRSNMETDRKALRDTGRPQW